jgi:hypothetical protein
LANPPDIWDGITFAEELSLAVSFVDDFTVQFHGFVFDDLVVGLIGGLEGH